MNAEFLSALVTPLLDMESVEGEPTNASESLARLAFAIFDEWVNNPTGKTAISMDYLAMHLANKDDPVIKGLGILERQMLWSTINTIKKEKNRRANQTP